MGFLDRIKDVRDAYLQGAGAADHWARIVSVQQVLVGTNFELEIHQGTQPAFLAVTKCFVPRGISPQVGQDVNFRTTVADDSTHYEILWDKSPQYAAAAPAPGASPGLDRAVQMAEPPPGDLRSPGQARLAMAENMLAKGLISQADFDRMKAAQGPE